MKSLGEVENEADEGAKKLDLRDFHVASWETAFYPLGDGEPGLQLPHYIFVLFPPSLFWFCFFEYQNLSPRFSLSPYSWNLLPSSAARPPKPALTSPSSHLVWRPPIPQLEATPPWPRPRWRTAPSAWGFPRPWPLPGLPCGKMAVWREWAAAESLLWDWSSRAGSLDL